MSEPIVNIDLKQIKAPSLTSTKYGKDIREQFENIDENFRRVSNHDYVEGKSGANINVTDLPLYENGQFTELGLTLLNDLTKNNVNWNTTLTWDYNTWINQGPDLGIDNKFFPVIYTDEVGTEHMICFYDYLFQNSNITIFYTLVDVEQEDIDSNRHYICSPQVYTFLDQRYANVEELGGINEANFYGLEDTSCLLTLKYTNNDPTFNRVNLFPTLYYESTDIVSSDDSDDVVREGSFKWKIYGNKTGIRAQGPKGDNGSSMSLWIVQTVDTDDPNYVAPYSPNPNIVPISKIAILNSTIGSSEAGWRWKDISDLTPDQIPSTGDACLVLTNITNDSDDSDDNTIADAFVSPAFVVSGLVCVTVNQKNSINGNSALNSLLNQLNQVKEGNLLGGLFIPYSDNLGAHFLYHENQDSNHVLHLQSQVPSSGTTLDVSEPANNDYDDNSKLDIKYGEINVECSNGDISLITSSSAGDINLYTDEMVNIQASRGIQLVSDSASITSPSTVLSTGGSGTPTISLDQEDGIQLSGGEINIQGDRGYINLDNGGIEINADSQGRDVIISSDNNTTLSSYGGNINLNTNHGLVKSNSPVTAKVNGIADVYLGCPIGTVVMWAGTIEPDGWLLCNGRDISTNSNYNELSQILGVTYNKSDDDNSIVRLPDLQQCFPLGAMNDTAWGSKNYNTYLGSTGGEIDHTLTVNEIPQHTHQYTWGIKGSQGSGFPGPEDPDSGGGYHRETLGTGGDQTHNNVPPFLAINFIIKYK